MILNLSQTYFLLNFHTIIVINCLIIFFKNIYFSGTPYGYICQHGEMIGGHDIGSRCIKMEKSKIEQSSDSANSIDLNGCKMTCGKFGALWPRPTGYVNLSEALFEVFPDNIALEMQSSNSENNQDKGIKSMGNESTILLFNIFSIIILFLMKNKLNF